MTEKEAKIDALLVRIEQHAESGVSWLEMNHADYEEIKRLAGEARSLLTACQQKG